MRRWLIQTWFDWMVEPLFREQRAHLPRYEWRMKVMEWLGGRAEEEAHPSDVLPTFVDARQDFLPPKGP